MTSEIIRIFRENLPDIIRSDDTVRAILSHPDNHVLCRREGERLVGVSVIHKNTIYLLCVDAPLKRRGMGSQLLRESEAHIMSNGYKTVVAGAGDDYIMPGIPMKYGAHTFFEKRGYVHAWGDTGCFDMRQSLKDFDYTAHAVGGTIDGITYRFAAIDDLSRTCACVKDAHEDFVEYYETPDKYTAGTKTPVLIAEKDGAVLGALIISIETEGAGLGSVGCTATRHACREQGIATNLVTLGTRYLKDLGLTDAFLGYTYTGILSLYKRAGYRVCMEYYMGEKKLS